MRIYGYKSGFASPREAEENLFSVSFSARQAAGEQEHTPPNVRYLVYNVDLETGEPLFQVLEGGWEYRTMSGGRFGVQRDPDSAWAWIAWVDFPRSSRPISTLKQTLIEKGWEVREYEE